MQHREIGKDLSMAFKASRKSRKLVSILKWSGCFTALIFAIVGLVLDVAPLADTYLTWSRGSWVIVGIAMAIGFTAAVLDRTDVLS